MRNFSPIPLFCLHFLGGSARSWDAVAAAIGPAVECIALDLPGFGDAANRPGAGVADMAASIVEKIGARRPARWGLAGHSMGAKVAMAVARKAEGGELAGLAGLALLAGSPPAPEPMDDDKRAAMLRWIDGPDAQRRDEARAYIRENVGAPLEASVEDRAVADVLRANPSAWTAWLTGGSKENWRKTIGVRATPTLVLSVTSDPALGPDVQERLMLPHVSNGRHVRIDGAGHLLPIERPDEVAALLREHTEGTTGT